MVTRNLAIMLCDLRSVRAPIVLLCNYLVVQLVLKVTFN